jgi:toxin ParE1/3/4
VQLVLHPDAQTEIIEAGDWYDQQAAALGDDFLVEIDAALSTVSTRPHVWPTWPGTDHLEPSIRRYLLARFRFYAIAYQVFDDHVLVLAVVHARRRPFYWLERAGR